jgi:hypothetical protein
MAMLDDNPVLRERLMAFGAFAGIAVFAVAAVDVMVTGGFDFGPGRAPYNREQPSAYVQMVDAANYVSDSIGSFGLGDAFARPPDTSASEERLAGQDDGNVSPANAAEIDGDNLYEEIAALYQQSEDLVVDEPAYEDAPAIDEEATEPEAAYDDQEWEAQSRGDGAEAEKLASAYGSESPW